MRDNLPNMLRAAAKEWRKENKVVATGATRYDAALDEAADAIEELSAIREEQKAQIIAMAAEDKPRWIPVTEALPEEYKDVLCYYEYFRFGEYNCMFRTIDRGYYGNGRWGGEAGQGIRNKVLAWMPLPEPPKEEAT